MSRLAFHRPARFVPPALPAEKLTLPGAPQAREAATVGTMFNILFAMLTSCGMAAYMIAFGHSFMVIIGMLFIVVAIGSAVGMRMQMRQAHRNAGRRQRKKYRALLATARGQARDIAAAQRLRGAILHPSPLRLWAIVTTYDRIWERRPVDPDFLQIRVGTGRTDLATPIQISGKADPMADYDWECERAVNRLAARMGTVDDQPSVVDIGAAGVVSILGPRTRTADVARALLCQIAVLHAPDDVSIAIDASDGGDWEWAKWLPHTFEPEVAGEAGVVPLVAASADDLADSLERELTDRLERHQARRALGGERSAPAFQRRLVVLFTRLEPISEWGRSALLRALQDGAGPQLGLTLIFLAEREVDEPSRVDVRIRLAQQGRRMTIEGNRGLISVVTEAAPDLVAPSLAELIARGLSPLRLTDEQEQVLSRTVSLTEMLLGQDVMEVDFTDRWATTPNDQILKVPIGTDGDGNTVMLDIKESARAGYGPHGLIVGATGSGKSELLRTLVMGMAMTHSPEMLSFVLIDFKGGAAFGPLTELPHVAGLITNLADDAAMVDRVHAALLGEIQRRQRLLRVAGNVDNIHTYQLLREESTTGPDGESLPVLPYLLIIVDEFGELLADRPDITDLFVQMGRVGRSLGIHLLMATQRLEEGRLRGLDSHLSYRICLRTFSPGESRTVIGTTDAYRLPSIPGSAYLKVDETIYQRLRVAHVSAPYLSAAERATAAGAILTSIVPYELRKRSDGDQAGAQALGSFGHVGPTELSIVVDRLRMVGRPVHQVWLPPLPPSIPLDALVGPVSHGPGRGLAARTWPSMGQLQVPLGVIDLPLQQQQQPLMMDFSGAHGHLAVVGAPRTGRSTALRTVLMAAMLTHTPDEVQFCCIDFGGGTLHLYASAPHVSAVAGRADTALIQRILAEVRGLIVEREAIFRELRLDTIAEFRQRRAAGLLPQGLRAADMFLVIDNWGALRAEFEDVDAAVTEIAARGLGAGVHIVLTASRWAEIRPALRDSIGTRMELRLHDPTESEINRPLAKRLPSSVPGRGIAAPGVFLQLVLPRVDGQETDEGLREAQEQVLEKIIAGWPGAAAPPVRILPTRVTRRQLSQFTVDPTLGVPIGLAEEDLRPATLDLVQDEQHLLIYGDTGSGRTEFLRSWMSGLMAAQPASQVRFLVFDVRRTLIGAVPDEYLGGYASGRDAATQFVADLAQRLRGRMPPHDIAQRDLLARNWWEGPDVYVVVDDYDLIGGPMGPLVALVEFLAHARDVGVHLVLACRVSGSARLLTDPVVTRLRDLSSTGLILSGDPREGIVFGQERAHPRPPGRGVLIRRAKPKMLLQLAIDDDSNEYAASASER